MASTRRVVVLGGGFAGVKCARTLRKRLPSDMEVVLFNKENHMVFHPMLAEVAGGSINPVAIATPLRQMLPGVLHRTEEVDRFDARARRVHFRDFDGHARELEYEHLVLACGSVVNLGMVPGMADHAFPMKTVGDAVQLRAHVMQRLEQAEVCGDPERKRWLLTFVVVGGGYSGVETAGELNDLARGSAKFFAHIQAEDVQVVIIHSRDQLLPEIGESLRAFAKSALEKAGVRVVLEERVVAATPRGVLLKSGEGIFGGTVVCTIGNTASPVIVHYEGEKDRNRVRTQPDMRLVGCEHEWAIGDCAIIENAHDGSLSPPTGQFAERQGRQCAENIARVVKGEPTRPFRFKVLGQLCSLGHHSAVAELMGMRISGFLAWVLWRGIYLMKMPSWSRRIKVGFDWAWQVVFSRDLSHLKPDTTERVSHAYYQPGEYVFRQGDPAASFYAIEKGEVEVVLEGEEERLLAVLGPGDFFGEMALVLDAPRSASVRARSAVEVVIMGREVFSQISGSLGLLKDLLGDAVKRRSSEDLWQRLPGANEILEATTARECARPLDGASIEAVASLQECVERFEQSERDFLCVLNEGATCVGVLEPSDLMSALDAGAGALSSAGELACKEVARVRADDSALVAARTMREADARTLVVEDGDGGVVGLISIEALISRVLRSLDTSTGALSA